MHHHTYASVMPAGSNVNKDDVKGITADLLVFCSFTDFSFVLFGNVDESITYRTEFSISRDGVP